MSSIEKKKVLFVGAGGTVAEKVLPRLADAYTIVGIAGHRRDLEPYCTEFHTAELTSDYEHLFEDVLSRHAFHAIVWNAVRYFPAPLLEASRSDMHIEFDIAVALPLECLRRAVAHNFKSGGTFIVVTSGLAFSTKPPWGSYSIVKRAQAILVEYLAQELSLRHIYPKAIALGAVERLLPETLEILFTHAIENSEPEKILYQAYGGAHWE